MIPLSIRNELSASQEPSGVSSMMRRCEGMIERELERSIGGIRRADLPTAETIRKYTVSIAPAVPKGLCKFWESDGRRPANKVVDDIEDAQIRRMAKDGCSARTISRELDMNPQTIRYYCQREKIRLNKIHRGVMTPERVARAIRLCESGVHLKQAAREMGLNSTVLSTWEERSGYRFVRVQRGRKCAQAA